MPTGIILAYSIPDGADVYVDGYTMPSRFGLSRTPAMIHEVAAGTHTITFRLAGYNDETKVVNVAQGGYAAVYGIMHPTK
jgi:hypothetical protein